MRRDRNVFHWALIASLLLHLVVIFLIVPGVRDVWPQAAEPMVQLMPPEPESPPLEFEFVDLAEDREEKPTEPEKAALSDMDRRAHGGEGERSTTPSSQGNTPQLVQADGGQRFNPGAPPQQAGPPSEVPQPQEDQPEQPQVEPQPEVIPEPEGAGKIDEPVPTPQPQTPRIKLPPPGVWALPPDIGGLRENPDRRGGGVDTGGLSFDTQWYDWGPYAKMMLAKIRRNWDIPEIARMGVSGSVRIRFFIERDGTVTGLSITNESGKPPMDNAARNAILDSSAFRPLPADLIGVDHEGVTITFFYNSKPPKRGGR
jgi:TonB family protein